MAKVEVFCKVRKRNIKIDSKVAEALVKMKRAEYLTTDTDVSQYKTKVMTVAPKPAATEPAATEPAATTENPLENIDAEGVIWDEEIHQSPKKLTKAGTWAKRRTKG